VEQESGCDTWSLRLVHELCYTDEPVLTYHLTFLVASGGVSNGFLGMTTNSHLVVLGQGSYRVCFL